MSNEQNLKIKDVVRSFKNKFGENLFAIISVGSLTTRYYQESWSDIDFLIVLEQISLADKICLANLKLSLEKKYQQRFGVNTITKHEVLTPSLPEITLDGKTLQGLLDLSLYPHRLIYCKTEKASFFTPDRKTIRAYSLSNIAMFLLRNRKSLTSKNNLNMKDFKVVVEKEIRASFIMTKLAIQYKNNYNCEDYRDIIQKAKNIFPSFDFNPLVENEEIIQCWKLVQSKKELKDILKKTDGYIESFASFVFKQTQK